MLFANLKAILKTEIKPGYILFGSDIFLINKAIELILEAAKIDSLNVVRLDETATEDEIDVNLRNISMFGGATAVVVRGVSETRVILQKGKAERVDCNPMSSDIVTKLIVNQISAAGKKIGTDAVLMLAQSCDNNYAVIDNEINKLVNFYNEKDIISAQDVSDVVTKTETFQVYELGNALVKKNIVGANKILQNLLDSGIDEYAVFGNLISFIRRMFYSLYSNLPDKNLAEFLKLHPYAVTSIRRDGRHLRDKTFDFYSYALDLEYQIKSGRITARHAIILLQGLFI